jgi:Putative auto-transporter adhesin, head GIN domain
MKRFLALALPVLVLFSSCHFITGKRIRGNGHVISQTRNFSNFTGVDVSNAIHLYVKQDSGYSVRVETDENLQEYIIVYEEGGILRVKQENNTNLDATGRIKVFVSAPLYKSLEASGACKIMGETVLTATDAIDVDLSGASEAELELKAPKISAGMSGASSLTLTGQTKDLFIEGSGACHAHCFGLMSENAEVDVSGASNADVFASVKLHAESSGASDVRYKGNAAVNQSTSGAGSVKKAE